MAEIHVDNPGEVTWFEGYGPVDTVGECSHTCEHPRNVVIAWGPDNKHYTLNRCQDCNCRGWSAEFPPGMHKPSLRMHNWRQPA